MTRRDRTLVLALLAAAVAAFAGLALDVTGHGRLDRLDARAARWVVAEIPGWAQRTAEVFTHLGSIWTLAGLTALGALVLLRAARRLDAAVLVSSLMAVSLVTTALKSAFGRQRPELGTFPLPGSASFPSGHTSGSTVVFVLLAVLLARRRRASLTAVAAGLAGLVGVSRVVVEAHWVTDVLAGYCVGAAVVAVALLVRGELSARSRLARAEHRPGAGHDREHGGDEERHGPRRSLPEHGAHDLSPVGELAEPDRG
jgi:undecaprenyl-diphosphatase